MDVEQNPGEESIGPRSSCSDSISAGAVDTGCNVGLGEWSEYECQYLGFTPKSFTNGGKVTYIERHVVYMHDKSLY